MLCERLRDVAIMLQKELTELHVDDILDEKAYRLVWQQPSEIKDFSIKDNMVS